MEEFGSHQQRLHQFLPLDGSSSYTQLHCIRKSNPKPWRATAKSSITYHVPGAGDSRSSSTPPKVYRVNPRGFRQLVQKLTGASTTASTNPAPKQRRLRDAAPAPLQLFHQTPVSVPQQHMFFPVQPQYTQYTAAYQHRPMFEKQMEQPIEVVDVSDDNYCAPPPACELQQQAPLPSPNAKMATGCSSPGDWAALLSPSVFSAWSSFPLLSPGNMTPIKTGTVN